MTGARDGHAGHGATDERAAAGRVRLAIDQDVAHITFDRPAARNAMTWAMYADLADAIARIGDTPSVRIAVLRGAGGKAFVAGTDIAQFHAFRTGEDGVAYERKIDSCITALDRIGVPTLAVVEGYAVGGGLAIANACDFRIAAAGARFGVPIARTLGNCLSAANVARLERGLGVAWVKRMLLLAEMPTAEDLAPTGYLCAVTAPGELDGAVSRICRRICDHAPITIDVTRETVRRLEGGAAPDISDLISRCYGSADFHRGVAAFGTGTPPRWEGR
ncbi:Enoyl-CoA hydratase/isomerase [Gluconacetobacter diazotrophicus PA1 5]|uniref:Putative 3-hydroxybutyryl-CoA dehydratase n=1 Tax=Gluconacetobacter diazotrophicus (strain ATCC 49037 / DSM 5601 / CCUG 37298 / CIP 103539 / LMG 7603 / PAl5) TaxID=272568 RepID=A9H963_GLUDA|nr:enoyl-CoA hydratase [Gluconacetobacter diazotrophicus]ACI51112.1 Enoyl-CoA hydratase/isomerase [Gluconacetobacter diazotrophicus PA1 5]TWB07613.1 enoyl-CoA hydratase/carnithine racemase [Gluconacetobacter diazotrophicus]CAP54622.1 putative 3-hydroxybutyryl-CoA dehydratase [Gluconacetobacter diazotrophicus PA1 5]